MLVQAYLTFLTQSGINYGLLITIQNKKVLKPKHFKARMLRAKENHALGLHI